MTFQTGVRAVVKTSPVVAVEAPSGSRLTTSGTLTFHGGAPASMAAGIVALTRRLRLVVGPVTITLSAGTLAVGIAAPRVVGER